MPDDEKVVGKSGSASGDESNEELELEVSGETEEQEELYGPDGKPLP